jgi:hypothetical protein
MVWLRNLHISKGSQVVYTLGQIYFAKFRPYILVWSFYYHFDIIVKSPFQ